MRGITLSQESESDYKGPRHLPLQIEEWKLSIWVSNPRWSGRYLTHTGSECVNQWDWKYRGGAGSELRMRLRHHGEEIGGLFPFELPWNWAISSIRSRFLSSRSEFVTPRREISILSTFFLLGRIVMCQIGTEDLNTNEQKHHLSNISADSIWIQFCQFNLNPEDWEDFSKILMVISFNLRLTFFGKNVWDVYFFHSNNKKIHPLF